MPPPSEASTSTLPMNTSTPCTRNRHRRRSPGASIQKRALVVSLVLLQTACAQVTVYTAKPSPTTTVTSRAPSASWTGLPVYDPLQLIPPNPPSPAVTAVNIPIPPNSAALHSNNLSLSVPQKGNFLGFSIELSIADSLMGPSGDHLRPEFLNYLNNIQVRAGAGAVVRVGGNTQDNSTIFPGGFGDGKFIEKIREVGSSPTNTPWINYSPGLLYTMANVSRLTHAEWYFGLAFNYTDALSDWQNIPVAAAYAQKILGSSLRGLGLGNEPDLYTDHGKRPSGWGPANYTDEWTSVSQHVLDSNTGLNPAIFVGPSTCCSRAGFELPDIVNTGWLSTNAHKLAQISVQHYPNNNCQLNGRATDPQSIFSEYLNHTSAKALTSQYADEAALAAGAGKELVMLEMNTASCGGFPGLSTSFGAALWMTDWALQLATYNFTTALMHVGGQNVYYNPFTPPPGNLTNVYQWTTGSVYYSTLLIAEIFGQSNKSRIADLNIQGDGYTNLHPAYAVYEDDAPSRVVLFNFVNDPSGASTYQATVSIPNGNLASAVHVRYFLAPSVAEHDNITWAGQNMGGSYSSDGKLRNAVQTQTIQCQNSLCIIPVPAPAIAVVYLTDKALALSSPQEASKSGFETTIVGWGSATVDPKVMETSNGQNGPDGQFGRNNKATNGAQGLGVIGMKWTFGLGLMGCILIASL